MEAFVSVLMITYNHEQYIKQAIEGILMQKCDFQIELIIGEDCSTDNTRQICNEYVLNYPEIKLLPSKINMGAISNLIRTFQTSTGKYIALCEGDDFWTDPYKLQKQVDFLEANPDYGLVHGDVNHLNQETGELFPAYNKTNKINIPQGDIFNDILIKSHIIKTMTVCFRRDLFEKYYLSNKEIMEADWRLIDISIWLMFAKHSKIYYFNEVFATYRLLQESMSRTRDALMLYAFHQKIHSIKAYFAENYSENNELKDILEESQNRSNLIDAFSIRNKRISMGAYKNLKKTDSKIYPKEILIYYATQFNWLRYIISLFHK